MTDDATRPEVPEGLPQATLSGLIEIESRAFLVLQVNIEGRDQRFLLDTNTISTTESSNPAAVVVLREIREQLGLIADLQLKHLAGQTDLNHHLERMGTFLAGIQSELQRRQSR